MRTPLESLADAVHGVTSPFVCGGTHLVPSPPRLRFPDGAVLTAEQNLLERCRPAKFGKGKRTRIDRTVRDAVQLDAPAFEVHGFDPVKEGIVEQVRRELAPAVPSLTCVLHSVNVYGRDGHFRPHKDTPRGDRMLGTLVVCLPSPFKMGQLVVMHRGAHRIFDWGAEIEANPDPKTLRWAAFFGDVDHAIERVWWGNRVTLAYTLHAGSENVAPRAEGSGAFASALGSALAARDFLPDGGTLAFPCFHMYSAEPDAANVPRSITFDALSVLKGRDLEVARASLEHGLEVSLRSFLIETCADEVWELTRFPTARERARLGARLDPDKLERALPLAGPRHDGRDPDVTWVQRAPSFNFGVHFYDPYTNPKAPALGSDVPALEYLHECEYSNTGYFGNEGSDLYLYLYSALYVKLPKPSERNGQAKARRSNVIDLDARQPQPRPKPRTPNPRTLVVDIRHWLDERGCIPREPARLRSQALRVARIIEYGGPIARNHAVGTLIECTRKPGRKPCPGFLWVEKLDDDTLVGFCMLCKDEEILVRHWQDTQWANGPMEPVAPESE